VEYLRAVMLVKLGDGKAAEFAGKPRDHQNPGCPDRRHSHCARDDAV
jgi:hypothetical protein